MLLIVFKKIIFTVLIICSFIFPSISLAKECVILLHGLVRTQNSMAKIDKALTQSGYHVVNQGYDSNKFTIETLSMSAIPQAIKRCGTASKIHFVTHSLGGILVRYYVSKRVMPRLNKVVMLGPPNKGSQIIDKMGRLPGFAFFNGPAGMQLGTGENSMPNLLGAANFDVGIIAGTKSINLILSTQLPNPDDGKVSVENTKLEGMNDHIVMPVTHTFMMRNKKVILQVLHYLRYGQFLHKKLR